MVVAVSVAWPGGVLLGATRVSDRLVCPVVQILPEARARLAAGGGPERDRFTLALWESWPADMGAAPPGRPVRIIGFVPPGRWGQAMNTSACLAGYGASLVVRRSTPTTVRLCEADYRGITVVVVDKRCSARVVVRGREGPAPGAQRTVALRAHEEHLFARALCQGLCGEVAPA